MIADTYASWMSDLSGLVDNLSNVWLTAIREVATESMTDAANKTAIAVQEADEHGVGTLVDSHRVITVHPDEADLTDCLDEEHWYVVNNSSGQPDPGVTRGYFEGTAKFTLVNGQWFVSSWNSHPQTCAP